MNDFHGAVLKMRQAMKRVPNTKAARLAFLLKWAEVRCVPDKGLTNQERRRKFSRMNRANGLKKKKCWVCETKDNLVRHHVIQLQHGGGNWLLNIMPVCKGCHAEVHPWLDASEHPIVEEAAALDRVPF